MLNIQDLLKDIKLVDLLKSVGRIREYEKFKKINTNNDLLDLSLNDLVGFCDLLEVNITDLIEVNSLKIQTEINTIKKHIQNFKHQVELLEKSKKMKSSNTLLENGKLLTPGEQEYSAMGYNIGKLGTIGRTRNALLRGLSNQVAHYETIPPVPTEPAFSNSSVAESEENVRKTAPRAQVYDANTYLQNVPPRITNTDYAEKATTVGTSPRADVNMGYAHKLLEHQEEKNIAVRASDAKNTENTVGSENSVDTENIANSAGNENTVNTQNTIKSANAENTQNISLRELVETNGEFDSLSKIPESFLESANIGVYHNVEEANKIFARQRKLEKQFIENPEKVSKVNMVSARNGVTCYPSKYNRECVSVIDTVEYGDYGDSGGSGEFNVYYSVFNKQGDYLFSEAYSCQYNDTDKEIKYYKKMFFDVIVPGMVFNFTDEDEISRESFYYGIYRQYRCFGFPV